MEYPPSCDACLPIRVYLYGPPASGKLTVAGRLAEQSGYRLFHNHLTVNAIRPVLDFGSEPFFEVLHRLRLDVFAAAARAGIDVIFTNNSAWAGHDGRARFAAFAGGLSGSPRRAGEGLLCADHGAARRADRTSRCRIPAGAREAARPSPAAGSGGLAR